MMYHHLNAHKMRSSVFRGSGTSLPSSRWRAGGRAGFASFPFPTGGLSVGPPSGAGAAGQCWEWGAPTWLPVALLLEG